MQLHQANHCDEKQSPVARPQCAAPTPAASLTACVYLAIECPHCGDVRQSLSALPSAPAIVCPECGTACAFVYLGKGYTARKLPFSEVRRGQPGLLPRRDEAP